MAQLITLSKLAALVSEYTGIEVAVCEAFIRNMAQTTANGLAAAEHIRIKDFGLFEIRQAPDGSPVVQFVPESAFAERVNAPFAHLRPTPVHRPAPSQAPAPQQQTYPQQQPSYSQQQQAYPQQPEAPVFPPQQPQAYPQQPEAPVFPPQQQAYPHQPEAPVFPPQQQAYPQQPEAPVFPPQQPQYTRNQVFPDLPEQEPQDQDRPSYLNLAGKDMADTPHAGDTFQDSFDTESTIGRGRQRQLPQIDTNKKFIVIGILGIVVGFFIGYATARYTSDGTQDVQSEAVTAESVADASAETVPPQEYDYGSSVDISDIDTLDIADEAEETAAPAPAPEQQITTVKLAKGQRLSDIALKHYGKKEYWVYIYLENRESIKNPFTVREGTVLRIPPKDKYAPTTDEATNLDWAKNKAAEINNKYIN